MKKANSTNKSLMLLTFFFLLIAAFSFAAFRKTKDVCAQASKCMQTGPSKRSTDMLWDGFSRRFITHISIN